MNEKYESALSLRKGNKRTAAAQVRWFREGESQLLDSVMVLGSTREEPTQSILTLHPKREDDAAVYRSVAPEKSKNKEDLAFLMSLDLPPRPFLSPQ